MRIDVRLPQAGPSSSSSSSSSKAATTAITSPPIAQLSPSGELVLIELQGALELEGLDAAQPQVIGMLTFEGPQQNKPVLLISHHRLYGKFVDMHQPLAILQKHQRKLPDSLRDRDGGGDRSSPAAKRHWLEQPWTSDVESGSEGGSGVEGEGEEDGEVEGRRKRAKKDGGGDDGLLGSSPCRPSSAPKKGKDKAVSKAGDGDGDDDDNDDLEAAWDEEDDEDEDDDDADQDEGEANDDDDDVKKDHTGTGNKRKRRSQQQGNSERKPRVWYDVVCLIRRKILFSQRPEPVVNLLPEHDLVSTASAGADASSAAPSVSSLLAG